MITTLKVIGTADVTVTCEGKGDITIKADRPVVCTVYGDTLVIERKSVYVETGVNYSNTNGNVVINGVHYNGSGGVSVTGNGIHVGSRSIISRGSNNVCVTGDNSFVGYRNNSIMSTGADWIGGLALTGSRWLFGCPRRKTRIKYSRGHRVEDPEGKKLWSFDGCIKEVEANGSSRVTIDDTECLDSSCLDVFTTGSANCYVGDPCSSRVKIVSTGASKVVADSIRPRHASEIKSCLLDASGASRIIAQINVADMDVTASGASKVSGLYISRSCKAVASGLSQINGIVSSNLKSMSKDASGAAKITLVSG